MPAIVEPSENVAIWIAALYCVGFALVFLELFIPGWVAGTAGVLSILAAIFLAWKMSVLVAILLGAGAAAGLPMILVWGVNRVSLKKGLSAAEGYVSSGGAELAVQVGKHGTAATLLRPSGAVEIDGRRYDARAERGFIERGKGIAVLRAEANELIVRERQA